MITACVELSVGIYHHQWLTNPFGCHITAIIPMNDWKLIWRQYFLISLANRLVDLRSTQPNESVNNTVASKTRKSTFYSGSKYVGHRYVLQVKWKIRFILEVLLPFHRNLLKLWKIFQLHLLHEFVMINCEILQVHRAMLLFRYDAQT